MSAPYPWFGGKSRVAHDVWAALGDPRLYVEPFAGSAAVLLARPAEHVGGMEVAGDLDHMLVNALRCFVYAPEALVDVERWPVFRRRPDGVDAMDSSGGRAPSGRSLADR